MTKSVINPNINVVTTQIKVDGNPLPSDTIVLKIEVDLRLNHLPYAHVTLESLGVTAYDFGFDQSAVAIPG